jgi:hypothetical protein
VVTHAHFRRGGADGREPIAAPGDVASIASSFTPAQQFWGKVTSKRPAKHSKADLELTAFRLGVKVAALREAIETGVLNG